MGRRQRQDSKVEGKRGKETLWKGTRAYQGLASKDEQAAFLESLGALKDTDLGGTCNDSAL